MSRKSTEPVLVLPSDSYSDKEISVDVSEPFSYPILYHLLTTSFTNYKN